MAYTALTSTWKLPSSNVPMQGVGHTIFNATSIVCVGDRMSNPGKGGFVCAPPSVPPGPPAGILHPPLHCPRMSTPTLSPRPIPAHCRLGEYSGINLQPLS